ncbi:hypothetical protein [Streptomyces sp. NPDC056387]|uniref:hypothetical protein n=1 Tax=Streptomyces sp. NPDC056387 TaxID=3345803 RepID=UPI0035DFD19F
MRTRLLTFIAAAILAALGAVAPAVQAAAPGIDAPGCRHTHGTVQYDPGSGRWICVGGSHDGESIN